MKDHHQQLWNEALPMLYRDHAGMILSGSFMLNQVPNEARSDLGFFSFPVMDPNIPIYEEVPVDAVVFNRHSLSAESISALTAFFNDAAMQEWFANEMGYLPAHNAAQMTSDPLILSGVREIQKAQGYTQYFDRDAIPALSQSVPRVIARFLVDADIKSASEELEQIRLNAKRQQPSK